MGEKKKIKLENTTSFIYNYIRVILFIFILKQ